MLKQHREIERKRIGPTLNGERRAANVILEPSHAEKIDAQPQRRPRCGSGAKLLAAMATLSFDVGSMGPADASVGAVIGYFFWHWPEMEAPTDVYERALLAFHSALRTHAPEGFARSCARRIAGAPWLPGGSGYEDRYLVSSFAALGLLNDAAVSPKLRQPHDAAAQRALGGTAGLYRLRSGEAVLDAHRCTWFSKPPRMSYDELLERLAPLLGRGAGLWQRQMTLGPTPEFCIDSEASAGLPDGSRPLVVTTEPVKG
jgi:hypothetical protein